MNWNNFKTRRPMESCQVLVEFSNGETASVNVFIDDESEIYTLPEGRKVDDIVKWKKI